MPPLYVSFTGFAIIGLTLFILALTIAISLLRLPSKALSKNNFSILEYARTHVSHRQVLSIQRPVRLHA